MSSIYTKLIGLGIIVIVNELKSSGVITIKSKHINKLTSFKYKKVYKDMMDDLGIEIEKLIDGTYNPLPGEIRSFVREYALRTSGRNLVEDLEIWGY